MLLVLLVLPVGGTGVVRLHYCGALGPSFIINLRLNLRCKDVFIIIYIQSLKARKKLKQQAGIVAFKEYTGPNDHSFDKIESQSPEFIYYRTREKQSVIKYVYFVYKKK